MAPIIILVIMDTGRAITPQPRVPISEVAAGGTVAIVATMAVVATEVVAVTTATAVAAVAVRELE
jgi:hypothetical protein